MWAERPSPPKCPVHRSTQKYLTVKELGQEEKTVLMGCGHFFLAKKKFNSFVFICHLPFKLPEWCFPTGWVVSYRLRGLSNPALKPGTDPPHWEGQGCRHSYLLRWCMLNVWRHRAEAVEWRHFALVFFHGSSYRNVAHLAAGTVLLLCFDKLFKH